MWTDGDPRPTIYFAQKCYILQFVPFTAEYEFYLVMQEVLNAASIKT